ncbi:helix-turn-helix domain-containing protein [Nocardia sp. NPDC004750]
MQPELQHLDGAEASSGTATMNPLRLYSIAEAAELLRVSEGWMMKRLRDRKLQGRKSGRSWSMSAADIQAAIDHMLMPAIEAKPDPWGLTARSRRRLQRRFS